MTTHHIVNSNRSPHKIPIVPAGPRIVWTIALAVNAPMKEAMIPKNRMSRDGTRRGEARHGSPNSSTSYSSACACECLVVTYCCRQDDGGVEWCSDTLIVNLVVVEGTDDSLCLRYPVDPS
jgi:hypothetical protein